MRELVRDYVRICAKTLPLSEPIYEFGSLQVPGEEDFADLRVFFPGSKYVGADIREGTGVDVILDLHSINLQSESVGTVLVLETLEHVEFPWKAMREIHRILIPDGIVVASSPLNFPIHNYPADYWRFTPEALRSLLRPFAKSIVEFAGERYFPHTVVGVGFKGATYEDLATELLAQLRLWKRRWKNPAEGGLRRIGRPFVPPFFIGAYRKIRGMEP